jgi:hypothetical protein
MSRSNALLTAVIVVAVSYSLGVLTTALLIRCAAPSGAVAKQPKPKAPPPSVVPVEWFVRTV